MLCNNELISDESIENYFRGFRHPSAKAFVEAIEDGWVYITMNHWVEKFVEEECGPWAKEIRQRYTTKWKNKRGGLPFSERKDLGNEFGGVCTAIQNLLVFAETKASPTVKEQLLKGRSAQNRPPQYQLDKFREEWLDDSQRVNSDD